MVHIAELIKKEKQNLSRRSKESGTLTENQKAFLSAINKWKVPFKDRVKIDYNEFMTFIDRPFQPRNAITELTAEEYKVPELVRQYIKRMLKIEGANLYVLNRIYDFKNRIMPIMRDLWPEVEPDVDEWKTINFKQELFTKFCREQREKIESIQHCITFKLPKR